MSYIDQLIRTHSTGSIDDLSRKLQLSKRMTYEYLECMKELGAKIKWSHKRNSYVYEEEAEFRYGFFQ
jgi:hypothetical protein